MKTGSQKVLSNEIERPEGNSYPAAMVPWTAQSRKYGGLVTRKCFNDGGCERDLVYWINDFTVGQEGKPRWATLTAVKLAELCGSTDPKNVERGLKRLLDGIEAEVAPGGTKPVDRKSGK